MMRKLVVACVVAAAIGASAAGAGAQTCTGTAVTINSVAPGAVNFGTATDPMFQTGYVDATVTVTTQAQRNRTIKLCVRSTDASMGTSTPPGYTKPLSTLLTGPAGTLVPVTTTYQFLQQKTTVGNVAAVYTLTVRITLSWTNDWPGNYLAHLQFAAWR